MVRRINKLTLLGLIICMVTFIYQFIGTKLISGYNQFILCIILFAIGMVLSSVGIITGEKE